MKSTWKIWLLILPALVLLFLVMSVDIAFYRIPSIINLFGFEREVAIWLLFLLLLPIIRHNFNKICWTPQRGMTLHTGIMIGLELILILPQVCLRRYLNLWDDNPFLAEYPFIWITVSAVMTVLFISGVLLALLNFKKLSLFRRKGNSDLSYYLLIGMFLLAAIVFPMTENRQSYQSMTILNEKLRPLLWPIAGLFGTVFFLNVYNVQWLTVFSRRGKVTASLIGLPIIASALIVFFSHLMTPVYAYSVSIKGFTLATLSFLLFFSVATEVVLLLSLPGARRYDRLRHQMTTVVEMGRMVQLGCDLAKFSDLILKCSMKITESEYGWIELKDPVQKNTRVFTTTGLPVNIDIVRHKDQLSLSELLKPPVNSIIVNDIYKDNRTLKMRLIPARWRSLLAMHLTNGAQSIGVLYLAKDNSFGYTNEDEQILEPLIVQAGINLTIIMNKSE